MMPVLERCRNFARVWVTCWAVLLLASAATAAPAKHSHDLTWYIHDSLVDSVGGPQDISYWQALVAERLAQSNSFLQGAQGPSDTPCCVELALPTVTTFSGANLDVIETEAELDAVLDGPAGGYITDAVWYCNGFSTSIRGCAGIDDVTFVVSLESEDSQRLPASIAHERGHNAGLGHSSAGASECRLMDSSSGGGCLTTTECQAFIDDADSSGGNCPCANDLLGGVHLSDGSACVDSFGAGVCSGAVCGVASGAAGTSLLLAAGAENPSNAPTDDATRASPLTGGWETIAAIGSGIEPTGLAYDPSRDIVFAVAPQAVGGDQLHRLAADTGAWESLVATLPYVGIQALAFDPTGDRLFATQVDSEIFGGQSVNCGSAPRCVSMLLEIDPDTGATTAHGEFNTLIMSYGVEGLAWDSTDGALYGSGIAGLFELSLACSFGACPTVAQHDNVWRRPSSLAYDAVTDTLYRQGEVLGRTEFDVMDPTVPGGGSVMNGIEVRQVMEELTPGGMTVVPIPEPQGWLQLAGGAVLLAGLGRRRAAGASRP